MQDFSSATISKLDWDILTARVQSAKNKHNFSDESAGLLAIVVEQIFPDIQDQLQEAVTDGPDDRGIDAVHIVEGEGRAEIYLFQSKYRESMTNLGRTINDSEILKISLF